jgi:hypothetical protein
VVNLKLQPLYSPCQIHRGWLGPRAGLDVESKTKIPVGNQNTADQAVETFDSAIPAQALVLILILVLVLALVLVVEQEVTVVVVVVVVTILYFRFSRQRVRS